MKTLSIVLLLAVICPSLHAEFDAVYFDNRSSKTLSIYKTPLSSRSRPVKLLPAGEKFVLNTKHSDQWVVAHPVWYRLVGSVHGSDRQNRLVIRDSDLRAIGNRALATKFANRSGKSVKVRMVVDGKELDWMWITNGRTVQTSSFSGQDWMVREQASGKLIQRATTPSSASTIVINPPRRGSHRDRDHDHRHDDHEGNVDLTITNTTAHTIAIYKKTGFGSRRVGSIATRKAGTLKVSPGDVYRVEDTITLQVLKTIVVPDNDPHCKVAVDDSRRPRPVATTKTKIDFHNDTKNIVHIYKEKDRSWKYTKRIYPGRDYQLEFDAGQRISIRDPKSGQELESLKAPSRDTTLHIEPHGDHAHTTSDHKPATQKPEQSNETPSGPRRVLRRILFGD